LVGLINAAKERRIAHAEGEALLVVCHCPEQRAQNSTRTRAAVLSLLLLLLLMLWQPSNAAP
jgi:hypothetical protein